VHDRPTGVITPEFSAADEATVADLIRRAVS
jgi:hypothetical protein